MNKYNGRNGNGYQPLPSEDQPITPPGMLPSQERLYKQRIKELEEEKKSIYTAALRHCTRVINLNTELSEQDKKNILEQIWEDML